MPSNNHTENSPPIHSKVPGTCRRVLNAGVWAIALAILAMLMWRFDHDTLAAVRSALHAWWLLPAVAISLFSEIVVGTERYRQVLRATGYDLTFGDILPVRMGALPIRQTVPFKAGEAARVLALKRRHNVAVTSSVLAFFISAGSQLAAMAIIGAAALAMTEGAVGALVFAGIAVAMLVFLLYPAMFERPARAIPGRLGKALAEFFDRIRQRPFKRRIVAVTALSMVCCSCDLISAWCVLSAFGMANPGWEFISVMVLVNFAGSLPLTPFGLGVREASLALLGAGWMSAASLRLGGLVVTLVSRVLPAVAGLLWLLPLLRGIVGRKVPSGKNEVITRPESGIIGEIYGRLRLSVPPPEPGSPTVFLVRVPAWLENRRRHPENCEAPLDLGWCASSARRIGFNPVILDLETGRIDPRELCEAAENAKPAAVFMSGITPAVPTMMEIARGIRAASPETTIGAIGQHADYSPETFLCEGSPFDLVTVSEYEATIAEALESIMAGGPAAVAGTMSLKDGVAVRHGDRPILTDLDALGMPDHEFFLSPAYRYLHPMDTARRRRWGFIQTSRGCPFSCIYCSRTLRTSFAPEIRQRSPESVVEEMKWLSGRGITTLVFIDDLFNFSKERVMTLCEHILSCGVKMSWTAKGRVRPADVEMFRMMKRAGCCTWSMGVESGSPEVIRTLNKRCTVEETEAAFAAAREAGLMRVAYFIVASPGETSRDFEMTRALLKRIRPEMIQVANFTCYPGSPAYENFLRDRNIPWDQFQHYEKLINLSAEPDEVARGWQKRLYWDLANDIGFIPRYIRGQKLGFLVNLDHELGFILAAAGKMILSPSQKSTLRQGH